MTGMTAEETRWVTQISQGVMVAQSAALANQYILMELVRTIARDAPDPHEALAGLFERVMARMDQWPLDEQGHPVEAEMRRLIETFFTRAGDGLLPRG